MAKPDKVDGRRRDRGPVPRSHRGGRHRVPRPLHDAADRHCAALSARAPPTGSPRTPWSRGRPQDAGVQGLDELFVGPTAIAFVQGEPVDAAKALRDFAKENRALVIKGGYMDGRPLTVAEVAQIADLESREVMLAKLAGAMQGSLAKAAGLFAAPASQVARLAAALQEKRSAAEPPSPTPRPPRLIRPAAESRRRTASRKDREETPSWRS